MYKKILLFVVLFALLAGTVYVSFFYNSSASVLDKYHREISIPNIPPSETAEGLSGTLLFSLAPKNEIGDVLMVPMAYRLGAEEGLIKSNLEFLEKYNVATLLNPIFSPNMSKVLFTAKAGDTEDRSLFTSKINSKRDLNDLLLGVRKATKINDFNFKMAKAGGINNNGEVLYSWKDTNSATSTFVDAEVYNISLIQNNEVKEIDKGIKPKWLDESNFVYLKNDGVYLQNIFQLESPAIKLINIDTSVLNVKENMSFNVSNDGKHIALLDIDGGTLNVFEIKNLNAVTNAEQVFTLTDVYGFWPVFSPNGDYLAYQSVDIENISTDPKPKVVFYKIDYTTKQATKLDEEIDLDGYYQDYMFIDSWIKL